jgi:tetratricopeptide (TPR) repeat protein
MKYPKMVCEQIFYYADKSDFQSLLNLLTEQGAADEDLGEALLEAAKEAVAQSKYDTAIKLLVFLLNALEDQSEAPPVLKFIGSIFSSLGNYEKARDYYSRLPVSPENLRLCMETYISALDIDGMLRMKNNVLKIIPDSEHASVDDIQNELMQRAFLAVFQEHNEQYKKNIEYLKQIDPTIFEKYNFKDDLDFLRVNGNDELKVFKMSDNKYLKHENGWYKVLLKDSPGRVKRKNLCLSNIISRCGSFEELLELIAVLVTKNPEFYKNEFSIIIDFKLLEQAMTVCDFSLFEKCDFVIRFIDENVFDYQLEDLLLNQRIAFPSKIINPAGKNTVFNNKRLVPLLKRCEIKILESIEKYKQQLATLYPDNFAEIVRSKIAKKEKLRILLKTSSYTTYLQYCTRDMADGFKKLGHEVLIEKENEHSGVGIRVDLSLENMCDFYPDIVFCIDNLRHQVSFLSKNIPFVTWVQDPLTHLVSPKSCDLFCSQDFIYASNEYFINLLSSKEQYNNTSIGLLPFLLNPELYYPVECVKKYDVSYVGNLYIPQNCEAAFTDTPDSDLSEIEYMLRRLISHLHGKSMRRLNHFYVNPDSLVVELKDFFQNNGLGFDENDKTLFSLIRDEVLIMVLRIRPVKVLKDAGIVVHLFGVGWQEHPWFQDMAHGVVQNGAALNLVINETLINLNLNPGISFHNKIPEVTGAGAFFLSRNIGEADLLPLERFFEPDKEIVLFEDENDLVVKVRHYLSRPEECALIARRAREKVLEQFTFEKGAARILEDIMHRDC